MSEGEFDTVKHILGPSVIFLLTVPRRCFFVCSCLAGHTVLSIPYSLVVTCLERADLLALLYVMFSCDFVTFPYGVLCQPVVFDWIASWLLPSSLLWKQHFSSGKYKTFISVIVFLTLYYVNLRSIQSSITPL